MISRQRGNQQAPSPPGIRHTLRFGVSMGLTIRRKLGLGFGLWFCLLFATGLILDWGLRQMSAHLERLISIAEPLSAAAYELEINAIGTGLGVMKYLETGVVRYQARIAKDRLDFARFLAQFDRFALTPEGQDLGVRAGRLYGEFLGLGETLIRRRDQREALLATLHMHVVAADDRLDAYLKQTVGPAHEQVGARQYMTVRLEASLAEMGHWLGQYPQRSESTDKARALDEIGEVRTTLLQLATPPLSAAEQSMVGELTRYLDQVQALLPEVFTLHETLQSGIQQFLTLRTDLDALLDDELQEFTMQGLQHAKLQARHAAQRLRLTFLGLLAVSLVLGGGVSMRLGQGISRAVSGLVEGARAIGRGALAHRIALGSRDELGEVTAAFNAMAAQRQQAEEALRSANITLEARVAERTAALSQAYEDVRQQLHERQQTERALRSSEARYRALFDNAHDMVYITDLEGHLLTINPAVETITGYLPVEVLGRRIGEFIVPEQLEATRQMLALKQTGVPATHYEVDLLGKDGRRVTLEVNSRLLRQEGEPVLLHGIARDISARKLLEAQVRQQQHLESMGTMASGIAHDFNNILTAVLGYTELALHDVPADSPTAESLTHVLTAGNRARELVRQMLTFSRQTSLVRQPVVLHAIVQEVLTVLRPSLPTTMTIQQSCDQETDRTLGDPSQLHRVLLNLCINAVHAMRDTGGVLEVRQERAIVDTTFATLQAPLQPGLYLRLSVSDTGCGMTPAIMERMFEPFFTTRAPNQGTGMGLAVVHGIVTSHLGAITVDSAPGQGTTFHLYLPCHEAAVDSSAAAATPPAAGQARVLLVDDEAVLVRLWHTILTRLGYDVTTCTSSVEALRLFREAPERYDIVVTDQIMPELTGDALIRELRRLRPDLPVVLCTGFSHTMTPQKAQELSINAFLMKPMSTETLTHTIRQVLAGPLAHPLP